MRDSGCFKVFTKPGLTTSTLLVAWNQDVGKVGTKVADYLNRKLGCQEFAEIEPLGFFPLSGVSVEDDIAQFPESKFYYSQEKALVVFKSDIPPSEWYRFLRSILDIAEHYCAVEELYIVGGMVSPGAHTTPRALLSVTNSPQIKEMLGQYGLVTNMHYETPDGQRPTLSSFLLWVAKKRGISGASLWVPVPFYLTGVEDPRAWKKVIQFFDTRLALGLDLTDLDDEIARQSAKIAQMRSKLPELDSYISRLESNLSLTAEESEKLAKEVEEFLKKTY
ncbi:MAG TPA: PAC2 family protein [Dehalococcoidia bacterium]|nr:PAC2 family protein [Dehalococcoidia bacterium]